MSISTAQLQGKQISEKVIKGAIPPTNLNLQSRTPNTATKSSSKFPFHLGHNRYLEIQIYNTIPGDPNEDLLKAAKGPIDESKKAFKSYLSSSSFINDATKNVFNVAGGTASGNTPSTDWNAVFSKSLDYAKEAAKNTFQDWNSRAQGFGNTALPNDFMDTIFLPLPNDIQEKLSYQYSEQDGLTASLIENVPSGAVLKTAIDAITGASNIISKATGRQALSYNKNLLAKFDGADFRDISLSWTLIPNNQQEAIAIQDIIAKLKAYSSPQAVANKLLLRAPFFAKLVFQNDVINEALQFKEVVITSIDVNWTVSGHMETFHDDMPKTISLTINFKDREPKTQEAWAQGMKIPGAE